MFVAHAYDLQGAVSVIICIGFWSSFDVMYNVVEITIPHKPHN